MTLRSGGAAAAGLLLLLFATTAARAQSTVAVPDVSGDQLLFFYDARPGRVSFLNVSNPSSSSVTVEIAFYSQSLSGRLGSEQRTIPAAGNAVIDPSSAADGSASGSAGLAVVTPIAAPGNAQPVVPPVPRT